MGRVFHYPGDYPSFTEVTERDYLSASKNGTLLKVAAREEKHRRLDPKRNAQTSKNSKKTKCL